MNAILTIATSIYNEKRYGRHYIALCDDQAKAVTWGNWLGTPGHAGELTLIVQDDKPCIVMKGQKDTCGNSGAPSYAVFRGTVQVSDWSQNKMNAVTALREACSATPDVVAMQAERVILIARLAEIDAALAA